MTIERTDVDRTVEAVWRMEAARVTAAAVRVVRDVGLAEEIASDAFVEALEQWPTSGVPDNPGAWLMQVARRRAVDRVRRDQTYARKAPVAAAPEVVEDAAPLDDIDDDVLALVFATCHPALSAMSRIALTLRVIAGLSTRQIARALLTSESTVGQRISRAKKTLADLDDPLEVPTGADLPPRLASVLEVVYLIFNEGYVATSGQDWARGDLMAEAIRLGRRLAALDPDEPEVLGLLALMEIQASRTRARVASDGTPVLLLDQDRTQWDHTLIRHALEVLERALTLDRPPGRYVLQAGIAACHARARTPEQTDWAAMVRLYDALDALRPSPVVRLNRAVALSYADGPGAALTEVERLEADGALVRYHPLHAVRGDLLERLGRSDEARAAFHTAAELTDNEAERAALTARLDPR